METLTPEKSFADELMAQMGYDPKVDPGVGSEPSDENPKEKTAAAKTAAADDDTEESQPAPAKKNIKAIPAQPGEVDPPTSAPGTADKAVEEDDIDDEKLLAVLRKKTGRDFKSLEEFQEVKTLTPEEVAAQEEQLRSEAIEFGKKNKVFTQKTYDDYVKFQDKKPLDVARTAFVNQLLKDDKELTADEANDLFEEYYHLHEDPESIKYKRGQADIKQIYDNIKRTSFGAIEDMPTVYQKVQENTKKYDAYTKTIESLFASKIPKQLEFKINDEPFVFVVDPKDKKIADAIAKIKTEYITPNMMQSVADQQGRPDEQLILDGVKNDLMLALFNRILSDAAKNYSDKKVVNAKLGRRGAIALDEVVSTDRSGSSSSAPLSLSDQMIKERYSYDPTAAPAEK